MTPWQALLLGIVEGLTEYLPVSSTGHLILASAVLGLGQPATRPALDAFTIVVQGGAVLAVLGLYRGRVAQMIRGALGRDPAGLRLAMILAVAFLPAAASGVLLNEMIQRLLFRPWPVIAALALGGALMIAVGPWLRSRSASGEREALDLEKLTWRQALGIGLAQCVAMWPGTSRSMVTIVGGLVAGLRPAQAAEFSFLLALPTLGGACAYSAYKSFRGGEASMVEAFGWAPLLLGFMAATLSAALAARWLVAWLTRHGLAVFGWYRLLVAALFAWLGLRGTLEALMAP